MMGSGMMAGLNHDERHSQMMASGMLDGSMAAHMAQMGNMGHRAHAGMMHSGMMENMPDDMTCDQMPGMIASPITWTNCRTKTRRLSSTAAAAV